ncbi:MAG: NAD-binding protein [Isosphaeraceae bacterium]
MRRSRKWVRTRFVRRWGGTLAFVYEAWNRQQINRIVLAVLVSWFIGSAAIHFAERDVNPDFATWGESLWSVWAMLFSGLESAPKTTLGRLLTMVLLVLGVGLAGLFTASVASLLITQYLKRREVLGVEMENHLVLCNWSDRGMEWVREVHSKIIVEKRPVVIIHDETDAIELPEKSDEHAFADVFIVKGDPTSEVVLRRARVQNAHSVVVLTDDREGKHADGKTILTCIAVRNICRGERQPNVAVECRNPNYRHHLRKAGADEIISATEFGLRLLARTALFHGMTRVYQELLTVGRDANEMYVVAAPEGLIGKDFIEVAEMFMRYRGDKRSCLLLGIQRGEDMILNPIASEVGPLRPKDELILLSRVILDPTQPLPTHPPIAPQVSD